MGWSRGSVEESLRGGEQVIYISLFRHLHLGIQIGEPTMIVNNAGVVQGKLILDLSVEDINQWVVTFFSAAEFITLE